MTTHTLAVLVGPLELIFLLILLAAPIILTVAHVFFMARFNNIRLDLRGEEATLLSEPTQLETELGSRRNKDTSTSTCQRSGSNVHLQIAETL